MSSQRTLLACFIALLAMGCDNTVSLGPEVAFSRPEHLAFTCFAPRTADQEQFELLPQACCSRTDPMSKMEVCRYDSERGQPVARLHALVTQSTRGEVAAVDMSMPPDKRVLDSDTLIPGYTFVDSGGLPTAVVVPPYQQRPLNREVGARFTFVASAEEHQIRAIPTCRFRSSACGPELATTDAAERRLRLPLPAAPADMILGPDGALWVTLPELALIARIQLADAEQTPADAFALDPATSALAAPQFFRVPEPASAEPPLPMREDRPYFSVCDPGTYVAQDVQLPIAPRAPMQPIRPLRLRFDAGPEGTGGVLLVSDAAAPVLHAFALGANGTLTSRGALPTGAPLRGFALTPPVPVEVSGTPNGTPDESQPTRRYLYAIDDRDGSLMVFMYAVEAGTPSLTPLLAPVPNARFADRIDVPAPAAALDVIDNDEPSACTPGLANERATPAASYLRGVFVAVVSQSGIVSVLDVHDVDVACRALKECGRARSEEDVAVRRHAARRSYASSLFAENVSNGEALTALSSGDCQAMGLAPVTGAGATAAPPLCAPRDPWYQRAEAWSVQRQAPLPGAFGTAGVLSLRNADAAELVLTAPAGLDFCGRGVLPDDLVSLGYPNTASTNDASCTASVGAESDTNLLRVVEARRDQLVLQPTLGDERKRRERAEKLAECFRDFVRFEVRAKDYLVSGTETYLHNVIVGEEGVCVTDPERPLLTSRAAPGVPFRNPFLAFTLRSTPAGEVSAARNVTVQFRNGTGPLTTSLVRSELPDVLPVTVRYQPDQRELYIVDSASQGLQRYTLVPFARENSR